MFEVIIECTDMMTVRQLAMHQKVYIAVALLPRIGQLRNKAKLYSKEASTTPLEKLKDIWQQVYSELDEIRGLWAVELNIIENEMKKKGQELVEEFMNAIYEEKKKLTESKERDNEEILKYIR